jgi:hypothetical protein
LEFSGVSGEALWREGSERDGGRLVFDEVGDDLRRCGGEEDAVAEVAGGDEAGAVGDSCADEGEVVECAGAEAGPGLEYARTGELREQSGRAGVEGFDVRGVDGGVEAGVFDGGADNGATGVRAEGSVDVFFLLR